MSRIIFARLFHVSVRALVLAALTFASPHAVPDVTPPSTLSPQLARIVNAIEYGEDHNLQQRALARQQSGQNTPRELRWNSAGQVQIYLHYSPGGATPDVDVLKSLGATGVLICPPLHVVQAWVPAANLARAAALAGVTRVTIPSYGTVLRTQSPKRTTDTGSVTTQGDAILGAANFRRITGLSGQGSVVGVISNGDDHAATDVATGNLPSGYWNDPKNASTFKSSGDEGTAMMEIVYDLAPGVSGLGFCGPATEADFLTCLDDFSDTLNTTVIVDDIEYADSESFFTDDDFDIAIEQFATSHPDIQLVTVAGNNNGQFWAGQWNSAGAPPVSVSFTLNGVTYTQALNFGNSTSPNPELSFNVPGNSTISGGGVVLYDMQWDDPWSDTSTAYLKDDYDVVLFDASNNVIAYNQGTTVCGAPEPSNPTVNGYCTNETLPSGFTSSNSSPGPQPLQGSLWQNTGSASAAVHLEVFLSPLSANQPGNNIKILAQLPNQGMNVVFTPSSTTGSIYGKEAIPYPAEISVGAVDSTAVASDPSNPASIEPFSSLGPVQLGTTSGQTVTTRMKPDFVGPDGVSVTGVGGFENPFFGTSAAAPHIAGLIALLAPAYPDKTPYDLLKTYATQAGSSNPNGTFGYGLPNLSAMLQAGEFPPPTASISSPGNGSTLTVGDSVAFSGGCDAHGASQTPSLVWDFGSGSGIADSSQSAPSVEFKNTGAYTITLTCTDSLGVDDTSVLVKVSAPAGGGGGGTTGWIELACLLSILALGRRQAIRS